MKKQIGYILFVAVLAIQARADNDSILSSIDEFLNFPSFDESFRDGEAGIFQSRSCISSNFCDEFNYTMTVKRIDINSIVLVSHFGDQQNESEVKITRNQWDADRGNRLRTNLNGLTSFGYQVELEKPKLVNCSYIKNQVVIQDECKELIANLKNSAGMNGKIKFLINKKIGGLGQILVRSQKVLGLDETTFLELR